MNKPHLEGCPNIDCHNNKDCCPFRKIVIPSVMGGDSEGEDYAPENGAYRNALVEYESNGHIYMYSSDGIPTRLTSESGTSDYMALTNKPSIEGHELVGDSSLEDIGVMGAIEEALEDYTPTSDLAEVAFSGDYDDLENAPTPPVTHFYRPVSAGVDIPTPLFHNPDFSDQVTYQQFEDAVLSGPVQIFVAEPGVTMTYSVRTVDVADIIVGSRMTFYATRNTFREIFRWMSSEDAPMYIGDDPYNIQPNWSEDDASSPDYIRNKPTIPAAQVNSDWNAASGVAQILNKPALAAVATSGSYDDLTDKPDTPSGLHVFYMRPSSIGDAAPIYHDYEKTNQVTLAQFIDAIASGPVQIYMEYDTRSFLIYYVDPIDAFIPDPPQYIGTLYANFGLRNPYGLGVEYFSWYEGATAPTYDSYDPNQSDWNETSPTNSSYIKNKPSLATVATSGSYNDLSDKPTIPAAQVNSDWNAASGVTQILNKPSLATVATSGSYNDLTNKPTIPTVNNATLTIQKNGTNVQTFTANQSTNATANITVPTKTSDLTNDSGFLDSVAWGDVTGKPTFATVATSGSYNDLANKPTIPVITLTTTDPGEGSTLAANTFIGVYN